MIEYLHDIGFLAPNTSLIHAVWLTPRDWEIIADTGATVQYNPFSNTVLGRGFSITAHSRKQASMSAWDQTVAAYHLTFDEHDD